MVVFLADIYASGGVSQHPGPQSNDLVNPFYQLLQAHEEFLSETDNRVALYYSLGNHMGDVERAGEEVGSYYGAARLLEDSHYSYDVLYQGDPDMGPGTTRWVDKQVGLSEMQDYQAVLLPQTRYMADAEVQNFLEYVESGGFLVVFGDAGTDDFSYPTPGARANGTWSDLVEAEGVRAYGAGQVLVFPNDNGANVATNYDVALLAADLASFQTQFADVYASDVDTDFGKEVHIHKWQDPIVGIEAFHLVNFDYDAAADVVTPTDANDFAFDPTGEYNDPRVTYYTPASPEGELLSVTSLGSGRLEVTIPSLHVYGIVVVEEGG